MTAVPFLDSSWLNMPWPARISPDVDRARTHHLAWVEERGLWPDPKTEAAYRAADFPLFVASAHPWAAGEDLDLVNDLIGWTWLWDDSFDKPGPRQADTARTARLLDVYRDILHGRPTTSPVPPLADAWRQLLQRLGERTSPDWNQRHAARWEATFGSYLQEARNNAAGKIPTFQDYLPMRRQCGGPSTCFSWIEAAGRYELPLHVYASEGWQSLDQDATDIVMMTNDLFSAGNEWNDGNTDNIIFVLAQQENCSWPQATRQAEEIINTRTARFQETEKHFLASSLYLDLTPSAQADTAHFINSLKAWMSGSLNWHRTSIRYQNPR